MADPRITQGGLQLGFQDIEGRVTQGGFVLGFADADVLRATMGGFILGFRTGPLVPQLTVTPGPTSALLTGSTYVHPDALPHLRSHFQVATDIGFTSLVYDNEIIYGGPADDPPVDTATPLVQLSSYWARVRYYAADGWSDFSLPVAFDTEALDSCGFVGPVTATTLSTGGLTLPNAWGNFSAVGNDLDNLLVAIQHGSLNGPRVKYIPCDLHDQAEVVVYFYFDGEVAISYYPYYGFFWSTYQSIEWSEGGAIALGKGTIEGGDFCGVTATLQIGTPAPSIFPCSQRGLDGAGQSYFVTRVWENSSIVKYNSVLVAEQLRAVSRSCGHFVKYGVRLQVTLTAPQTWNIKAAWEEDVLPPSGPWDIETSHVSEVLDCGLAGPCGYLLPGATLGAAGALVFEMCQVQNITENCVPGDGTPSSSNPTVVAAANCGFINAIATGWSGPGIGPATEAKWDIRLTSDSSLLYTTGWQSDQILGLLINLFDHPEIPLGTQVDVEVTLRDAALNTSTTASDTITTGRPPNAPTLEVTAVFANVIIVEAGAFSSSDVTAVHTGTTLAVFLASDTDFSDPVVSVELTAPEALTGTLRIEHTYEVGQEYRVRVIYTDQYGCASTGLTEFTTGGQTPEEGESIPPIVCPEWDECALGVTAPWVKELDGTASWTEGGLSSSPASWETDCEDGDC